MPRMQEIPNAVIGVVAQVVGERTSHAVLNAHFMASGAPGEPPPGNCLEKVRLWLRQTNEDTPALALNVLGKILSPYFDDTQVRGIIPVTEAQKNQIQQSLGTFGLRYAKGGIIVAGSSSASRSLEDVLRSHDIPAMDAEFARALENIETNPREAVSAASNILETLCKVYIAETPTAILPNKQDIQSLWNEVRRHLGWDPGTTTDADLRQMLSGLVSTVTGVGSLRTHASAAHGAGPETAVLEARHARLAVSAAHAVATFVIESWVRPTPPARVQPAWMVRRP